MAYRGAAIAFSGQQLHIPKICKAANPREEELLGGALEPTNSWYAIAKIAGIKLCEALKLQHGFDAISLMPTNLYGPGDNYHQRDSHVLPALIRRFHDAKVKGERVVKCWGTGTPLREFLHADDLGEACVFSLENWSTKSKKAPLDEKGEPLNFLNVGTGLDLSINELAHKVANTVNYKGAIEWDKSKPDGTPKKLLDVSRLTEMGWKTQIELNEGLKMAYNDFKKQLDAGTLRK